MEVKINKEIRDYTEAVFFGLSLRQCVCSALACGVAAGLYFAQRKLTGTESLSWLCMLAAFPFAAAGFVKVNGMPLEDFARVWFRSEFLVPKRLVCRPENLYYEIFRSLDESKKKKGAKRHEKKH